MATERPSLDFPDAAGWRRWLARNHDRSDGEWVYLYKTGARRVGLRYREALDEALCFGWIDGRVNAVDEDRFRQRWTPRRKNSTWSEANKRRVRKLTRAGRMAPAGLAAVRAAKRDGRWAGSRSVARASAVPPVLLAALRADPEAFAGFRAFAPSYRRMYAGWVLAAKTDDTRRRRVEAVVRRSRQGQRPGIGSMYE
ncbi:MAG: YdeI/OmpD-associated family protein [bacterium]